MLKFPDSIPIASGAKRSYDEMASEPLDPTSSDEPTTDAPRPSTDAPATFIVPEPIDPSTGSSVVQDDASAAKRVRHSPQEHTSTVASSHDQHTNHLAAISSASPATPPASPSSSSVPLAIPTPNDLDVSPPAVAPHSPLAPLAPPENTGPTSPIPQESLARTPDRYRSPARRQRGHRSYRMPGTSKEFSAYSKSVVSRALVAAEDPSDPDPPSFVDSLSTSLKHLASLFWERLEGSGLERARRPNPLAEEDSHAEPGAAEESAAAVEPEVDGDAEMQVQEDVEQTDQQAISPLGLPDATSEHPSSQPLL